MESFGERPQRSFRIIYLKGKKEGWETERKTGEKVLQVYDHRYVFLISSPKSGASLKIFPWESFQYAIKLLLLILLESTKTVWIFVKHRFPPLFKVKNTAKFFEF